MVQRSHSAAAAAVGRRRKWGLEGPSIDDVPDTSLALAVRVTEKMKRVRGIQKRVTVSEIEDRWMRNTLVTRAQMRILHEDGDQGWQCPVARHASRLLHPHQNQRQWE